jgi:HemY protein
MIRTIWFMTKVVLAIAITVWMIDRPGMVSVAWQGWVVETSVMVVTAALLLLLAVAGMLSRVWQALRNAPGELTRRTRTRRRDRGYRALTQGLVAVAAGDVSTAQRMVRRAGGLLNEPPLTLLLSAQAAQLAGDESGARDCFTAMLDRPETAFLGLRGLLTQALKAGRRGEALGLARRARALQPAAPWVLTTLFDLESRNGEWAAAEATLQAAVDAGAIASDDGRRLRTVLLLERSAEAEQRGREDAALGHAQAAHDLLPGFVPASVRLAMLLSRASRAKAAAKVVERSWRLRPHPELAEAYREALDGEDPLARVKRFEGLYRQSPGDVESHLGVARAALSAKIWGEARHHLNTAMELRPSRRVHRLMAELERAEHGNEDAARDWQAKALSAPADPAWVCRSCGTVATAWSGRCGHCGAFDSLEWTSRDSLTMTLAAPAAPAGMLSGPGEAAKHEDVGTPAR